MRREAAARPAATYLKVVRVCIVSCLVPNRLTSHHTTAEKTGMRVKTGGYETNRVYRPSDILMWTLLWLTLDADGLGMILTHTS